MNLYFGKLPETLLTCSTREVGVYYLLCVRVQVHKHAKYKLSSCYGIPLRTYNVD